MSKKLIITILVFASAILLAVLTPSILRSTRRDAQKADLIANHLYDSLYAAIGKPFVISQCMSSDTFLVNALKSEGDKSESQMEDLLADYLSSIKKKFGYLVAYVISEKTRRYYTSSGIAKIINPQRDPYDSWFQLFLDSNQNIRLDTDRDEVYDYRWTVFVNARIEDSNGNLVGVCGIGVFMDELQELLSSAEAEYGLKINLIDNDGLVQIDTDSANIKNAYISEAISDKSTEKQFTYTPQSFGGFRMTRYMADLNWYLVVQDIGTGEKKVGTTILIICIYLMLLLILIADLSGQKDIPSHRFQKPQSVEDSLTGLPNRNYLKESFGELGIFNTTRYKSLVMFDIDKFKVENETKDGDEIILGVVKYAKEIIGDKGIMFRWSGDEFVIFYEIHADEAEVKFSEFCALVNKKLDVSVSVGVVEIDLSQSIKTNYHRAVQLCYAVKTAGGNGVKREV